MAASMLEALPPELIVHIVPLLAFEDCMSLRCTSKPLRSLLEDEGLCELMTEVTYSSLSIKINTNQHSSSTSNTHLRQIMQLRTSSATQMLL